MSAVFGYEGENETAQQSAVAVADVHLSRADLPTYSELVAMLRRAASLGDLRPVLAKEAAELLGRLGDQS